MITRTKAMWTTTGLTALLAAIPFAGISGQGNLSSAPARTGTPEARVAVLFAAFAQPGQPGCAVGVYRDGRVILAEGYGLADVEKGVKNTADTVFNVGSVSKQFTAFAIRLLAADGKLSLDDPIVKFVPELKASAPRVTIRELMHHTGGLRDYVSLLRKQGLAISDIATQKQTLDALASQTEADAPPGTRYAYSNTGYFVLSLIVERASGQTMKAFSQQHLFAPLAMRQTSIVDAYPTSIAPLARGYSPREGGGLNINETRWEQTGDGQVHTTVRDLQKWDENFYTGSVGGTNLIRDMLAPGTLASGEALTYASGLQIGSHRGLPTVRHSGSWAGYGAHLLRFPAQHFSVAVMCNRSDSDRGRLVEQVAAVYLGALMQPETPAALASALP